MAQVRAFAGLIFIVIPLLAGCLSDGLGDSIGRDECRFFDARECYYTTDASDVQTMHIVGLHLDQTALDTPNESALVDVPWHDGPVQIRESSFVATGPAIQMTAVQTTPCPECRLTLVNVTLDGLNDSSHGIRYVAAGLESPSLHLELVDVTIKGFNCGVCLVPAAGLPRLQESSLSVTDTRVSCGGFGIGAYVDVADFSNVTVTGCSSDGIFFDGSEFRGSGVTLAENEDGALIYASESATFTDSIFERNSGSGLYVQSPASTLTGLQVMDNGAPGDELLVGGIFIRGEGTLHDSWIEGNEPVGASMNVPAFDATGNYWGHPDGPTPGYDMNRVPHTPKVAGDRVDAYSQFVPYLSSPP